MMRKVLATTICLILILTGCTTSKLVNLMENIQKNDLDIHVELTGDTRDELVDFSLEMFKKSIDDRNTLLSPVSILYALAMTTNGADNNTLQEIENTLGVDREDLNKYFSVYMKALPQGEKYKTNIANSIWVKDDDSLVINHDFLQTNADYYDASIYKTVFNESALKSINDWVHDNTDGMIKKILDRIPSNSVMFLINALVFDAQWQSMYEDYQVRDGIFTKEDGSKEDVEMMYSSEYTYLEDELATGFIKYYKERKYAFVALLPNEDIKVDEYITELSEKRLTSLFENPTQIQVRTAIPKFEAEYSITLNEVLKELGIQEVFDPAKADFSKMGTSGNGNLYISDVVHKTYISVFEKGSKAGAVTVVSMNESAAAEPMDYKTVYLDRPFVYMIIDCETETPLFIGVMKDINK